jgi:collagen triple helix repeat protein
MTNPRSLINGLESLLHESKKKPAQLQQARFIKGEKGDRGPKGNTGPQGTPGKDGLDGADGCDGQDGERGRDGEAGRDGVANIEEVLHVADKAVQTHEAAFDHKLIDPFLLGTKHVNSTARSLSMSIDRPHRRRVSG